MQYQQRQQGQPSQSQTPHNLLKLSDTGMTLSSAAEDIRGRKVVDANGEDIGDVDDLMIDDTQNKVRFIRVASGGFLGMGATKFLIPVDAIKQIKDDKVVVSHNRKTIAGAPAYDPDVVDDRYYDNVSGYYGYGPYWEAGYVYPGYPLFLCADDRPRPLGASLLLTADEQWSRVQSLYRLQDRRSPDPTPMIREDEAVVEKARAMKTKAPQPSGQ